MSPSTRKISARSVAAQARRALGDGVQHPLQVGGRPADDLQHLGGRRLLLQRLRQRAVALLQLGEQAGVLDGDHGLVGEGLDQGDLAVGEGAWLRRVAAIVPMATPSRISGVRPTRTG